MIPPHRAVDLHGHMQLAQAVTDPSVRWIVELAIVVLILIGGGSYAGKRVNRMDGAWQQIIQAYVVQVSGLRAELADERRRGNELERERDRLLIDLDDLRRRLQQHGG